MTTPRLPALAAIAALALALGGCAGTDDASLPTADDLGAAGEEVAGDQSLEEQGITEGEPNGGGAAGSCLAGDADCVDESYSGGDVSRPVLLSDAPSGATAIESGTSSGATATFISNAYLVDDTTLELTFDGGPCDVLEDVLVTESDAEVRLMVLTGQSQDAEMCAAEVVQWSTTVTLGAPLGDRQLLDLAG